MLLSDVCDTCHTRHRRCCVAGHISFVSGTEQLKTKTGSAELCFLPSLHFWFLFFMVHTGAGDPWKCLNLNVMFSSFKTACELLTSELHFCTTLLWFAQILILFYTDFILHILFLYCLSPCLLQSSCPCLFFLLFLFIKLTFLLYFYIYK